MYFVPLVLMFQLYQLYIIINIYTCFVFYRKNINKTTNIFIKNIDRNIKINDIWEEEYYFIETLILGAVKIQNKYSNINDSTVITIKQN